MTDEQHAQDERNQQQDVGPSQDKPRRMSRRRFLESAGAVAAGWLLSRCMPGTEMPGTQMPGTEATAPPASAMPEPTDAAPRPTPTSQPTQAPKAKSVEPTATAVNPTATAVNPTATAVNPTATAVNPTATAVNPTAAVAAPTATSEAGGGEAAAVSPTTQTQVAIGSANTYEPGGIESTLRDMLDGIGGLSDIIGSGDRVAIKVNLTGGLGNNVPGYTPMDTFVTHPETVRALGALVRDAGAREVLIVESVYQWGSYTEWGFEEAAEAVDATLIDLNATDPYDDYMDVAVPGGVEIYETYIMNRILHDVDAFISLAKMKCHWTCGVTHAMKNLVGLVPARFYQLTAEHSHRSAFHGPSEETAGYRVPRIITELNRIRPIDLAVVDGIKTTEAGEGPWIGMMAPVQPGVIFAGKDAVATDAVATAAQGFDPTAAGMTMPFVRSDNHLALAHQAGLGTHRLGEIGVVGPSIADVRYDFKPCVG